MASHGAATLSGFIVCTLQDNHYTISAYGISWVLFRPLTMTNYLASDKTSDCFISNRGGGGKFSMGSRNIAELLPRPNKTMWTQTQTLLSGQARPANTSGVQRSN